MPEIYAIILAAGKSERMGKNKMLLPFRGKSMIRTVIDNIMHSGIEHIRVVLGAYREDMMAAISDLPVESCYNANYEQGMYTSVQCGFRNLPATADAALLFLGDQPMVPGEVARQIIRAYQKSEKGILIPVHRGKRGHPVMIGREYANLIETSVPANGLHTLFAIHKNDIQEVEIDTPVILRDIDTEYDYNEEIKLN